MAHLEAILWDMDGVLVDNSSFHEKSWIEFCQLKGFNISQNDMQTHVFGRTNRDCMDFVARDYNLSQQEKDNLGEEKEALYRQMYARFIKPVDGLYEFMALCKSKNIKNALATSACRSNIDFTLKHLKLENFFDTQVDASMVKAGKPDPEIYILAAHKLGVLTENCLVIEDSLAGIRAGLDSGAKVLALPTTHTKSEIAHADKIIDDFRAIDNLDIINQLF